MYSFFLHKIAPLTSLLKKENPNQIIWNADCEKAFGEIEQALASKPSLAIFATTFTHCNKHDQAFSMSF